MQPPPHPPLADVSITTNNDTAPLMLFQQQALLTGARKGRNFQIAYTVSVAETGLSASCEAYMCSIAVGDRTDPPECHAFNSSGITRDATVCPKYRRRR